MEITKIRLILYGIESCRSVSKRDEWEILNE